MIFDCLQDDEDEDSEEDSDDDDTAALLAELEKIKKERAEEQERKVKYHFIQICLYILSDRNPEESTIWSKWRHGLCLRKNKCYFFFAVNVFFPILGAGAKGRGGKDSHGEYTEWQSAD